MNLKYILIALFGTGNVDEPARLQKQPVKKDFMNERNGLIERNFYIIALATIIFLLLVFVICCFMIVGMSGTESGLVYNNFDKVI